MKQLSSFIWIAVVITWSTSMFLINVDMVFSQSIVASDPGNVSQIRQEAIEPYQSAVDLWIDGTITNPKQAVQLLNQAIEIDPTFVEAYHYRGLAYSLMGNAKQALLDYQVALEKIGRAHV